MCDTVYVTDSVSFIAEVIKSDIQKKLQKSQ